MNETQVGKDRSIVAWLLRRPRTTLGIVALIIGVAVIGAVGGTTLRSRARVDFVTQRLRDTGRIPLVLGAVESGSSSSAWEPP